MYIHLRGSQELGSIGVAPLQFVPIRALQHSDRSGLLFPSPHLLQGLESHLNIPLAHQSGMGTPLDEGCNTHPYCCSTR